MRVRESKTSKYNVFATRGRRRMRCPVTALLACWVLICAPTPAVSQLLLKTDLGALCDRANTVVVGRAVEVRKAGTGEMVISETAVPADLMVAKIDVSRFLKGAARSGSISVRFSLPRTFLTNIGGAGIVAGEYGVFFLRDTAEADLVLDPDYPRVVASPGSPQTPGTVLEQVTAEVSYVLESPKSTRDDKRQALLVLRGVSSPAVTEALRSATRDPITDVRVSAMALLLRRNDISELATTESLLLHPPSDINQSALDELAFAIRFGVRDPKAIPSLARLVVAKNANVRKGAASALRRTHGAAAIEPLTRALYDDDPEVLYQAVIGLAELTHTSGEWAPAESTFAQDPNRYVDHWKEWAESRK